MILISLDTLRYDHCGFNGYARDTTPFLDSLAQESLVFDRAYTTMSWTLIAHMGMLTGLYPFQHGVTESDRALTPSFPTLAERLGAAGWTTLGVHYPGWLDPGFGFGRGFEVYEPASNAQLAGERLQAALQRRTPARPFFLFLHLFDIHSGDLSDPAAPLYAPPEAYRSLWIPDAARELEGVDAARWWDHPSDPTLEQHDAIVALYDGGVRYVDDMLRAWFTEWRARGLLDHTLVIITADHGEGLRQREARYGGHGDLNEEGLRVPLLVRFPDGRHAGERSGDLVSHVDLVPTVLDATGLAADPRLPGRPLGGPGRAPGEWVFAGRTRIAAAISLGQKLIYRAEEPRALYDLARDPLEHTPLTASNGGARFQAEAWPLFEALRQTRASLFAPRQDGRGGALDDAARARLEALGYAGELAPEGGSKD
ncbi:MAG: sulfatase [Planctomycetota bacterium]